MLVAPAVIVMLAVTAYPLGYSVWLSLQRYNLRFPEDHEFVGLSNYGKILSSSSSSGRTCGRPSRSS